MFARRSRFARFVAIWIIISHLSALPLAYAGPEGGVVAAGSATIGTSGAVTTVTQSTDRAVVNWQGFSTAAHESVRFAQPSASAVTLNRVTGSEASRLDGSLSANGRVFILNPNGVVFGAGSRVDTAGLVATTLSMKDADFMAGRYQLSQDPGRAPAAVVNRGHIRTTAGGSVALIGGAVSNEGTIEAPGGRVALAAGQRATVNLDGAGLVNLCLDASPRGDVQAPADAAGVLSTVVNNSHLVEAGSVTESNGVVTLGGGEGIAANSGQISVDGGAGARAGQVTVHGTQLALNRGAGVISAQGTAAGQKGGTVEMIAPRTGVIDTAKVDVSGRAGGGVAHVGGARSGEGGARAKAAIVTRDAEVTAKALETGDGGEVIVFGQDVAKVAGTIDVQGAEGGKGGFVETSGHTIDVKRAPVVGVRGEWLIDPFDLTINNAGTSNVCEAPACTFTSTGCAATLCVNTILCALSGCNVTVIVQTGAGTGAGNLTVANAIDYNGKGTDTLVLRAHNDVRICAQILDGTPGGDRLNVNLQANFDGPCGGGVLVNTNIDTSGGTFIATGASFTMGAATIDTQGGAVSITAGTVCTSAGTIRTDVCSGTSGNINITSNAGDMVLGHLDARGGTTSGCVTLATTQQIRDGNSTCMNVEGAQLLMVACQGIGICNDLETHVNFLNAAAGTGNIVVRNAEGMFVTRAATGVAATPGDGSIFLTTQGTGNLLVFGGNTGLRADGDTVSLTSSGSIVDVDVCLDIQARNVCLVASSGITGALDILMDGRLNASTTTGSFEIGLNGACTVKLGNLTAPAGNGTITATGGTIQVGCAASTGVNVSGAFTLTAPCTAVFQNTACARIAAADLLVNAQIFGLGCAPILTNVSSSIAVTAATAINIDNSAGPHVGSLALSFARTSCASYVQTGNSLTAVCGTLNAFLCGTCLNVTMTGGDVAVGQVNVSNSRNVTLAAPNGRILDDCDAGANDIIADVATLTAQDGIGVCNPLETLVGEIALTSTGGDIGISEVNGLIVRKAQTGIAGSGNGNITIATTSGSLQLGCGTCSIRAEGDAVTLSAACGQILDNNACDINVATDSLTLNSKFGIGVGAGGALEVTAKNAVTATNTATQGVLIANVGVTGAVAVSLDGPCGITYTQLGGSIALGASSGGCGSFIVSNNCSSGVTVTGPVSKSGTGTLALSAIGAGADLVLNDTVTATCATINLFATDKILGASTVSGSTVSLTAAGGVGDCASAIHTAAATISAASSAGQVLICNNFASPTTISTITANGRISYCNQGCATLIVGGDVTSTNGNVALTAVGGDIQVNAPSCVIAGTGQLARLFAIAGDLVVNGSVISASGSVNLDAGATISGTGTIVGNNVVLNATGTPGLDTIGTACVPFSVDATCQLLVNLNGTDESAHVLDPDGLNALVLNAHAACSGSVVIELNGGANQMAITANTLAANAPGTQLVVNCQNGNLAIGVTNIGGASATISAAGSLLDNATNTLEITAGSVSLTAGTCGSIGVLGAGDLEITATTIAATAPTGIRLESVGGSTMSNIASTVVGSVTLVNTGSGNLTANTVSTANGSIVLTTVNNLDVASITANGACRDIVGSVVGNITINGALTAAGDTICLSTAGNINGSSLLTAGDISLSAGTGIGNVSQVQLAAPSLTLNSTGVGNVSAHNTSGVAVSLTGGAGTGSFTFDQSGGGALAINTLATTDGAISVTNTGGNLTVATSIAAGGAGRNVTLSTVTSGNIVLCGTVSALGDVLTITSAGGSINGGGLLSAGQVNLNGPAGIGNSTALNTSATTSVSASNGSGGGIDIDNSSPSNITANLVVAGGAGAIHFDNAGGGALTVTCACTQNGAVVITNTGGNLTVGTAIVARGTANVDLSTISSGNIVLTGTTTATNDAISLTSAGTICGGGLISTGGAGSVVLCAQGAIGAGTALSTVTTNLAATVNNSGNLRVNNNNAAALNVSSLSIACIGNITVNQTGGGAASFTSVSGNNDATLQVTGANLTLGNASLAAGGAVFTARTITSGGVVVNGCVSSATGSVVLDSAGTISGGGLVTGAGVTLTSPAGITNACGFNTNAGNLSVNSTGGSVDINDSGNTVLLLTKTGASAPVQFDNSGGLLFITNGVASTGGALSFSNTCTMVISGTFSVSGGSAVSLVTSCGADVAFNDGITNVGGTITVNASGRINGNGPLTAASVTLNATGGIGDVTPVVTTNTPVVSFSNACGDVQIDVTGATAATVSGSIAGPGAATIDRTGGALTLNGVTTADGAIAITGTSSALTIGAGGITAGGTGANLTLSTITSGNITLTGALTAAGDTVAVDAAGSINGAGLITAGTVDLDADTGIGNTTALELAGSTITLDTLAGGVNVGNALGAAVLVNSLTSGGTGDVTFAQCGGGAVTFGTVTTACGTVTLDNLGAGITVAGAVTAGGAAKNVNLQTCTAGNITLTGTTTAVGDTVQIASAGDIRGSGLVTASTVSLNGNLGIGVTGGAVSTAASTVNALNGGGGGIDVNNASGAATTAGLLRVIGAGSIAFDQTGGGTLLLGSVCTANGAITITNTGGDLTVGSSVVAGGASNITLRTFTASKNILLTGTTTAAGDNVTINSFGNINGAGLVTGGSLCLVAVSGIGDVTPLATAGGTVVGSVGSGNIRINNTTAGAAVVVLANACTGNICFNQTGGGAANFSSVNTIGNATLQVTSANLALGTVSIFGNLTARTLTGGNIDVAGNTSVTSGVTLQSVGTINGCGVLGANNLSLTAGTGIGTTGAVCTAANTIVADTTTGGIALADTGNTAIDLGAGTGAIVFDNTGGTLTVNAIDAAGGGAVSVTASCGLLQVDGAVNGSGTGAVTLRTLTCGDLALNASVTNAGGTVNLDAAGAVNGCAPLQGDTVNVNAGTGIGNTTALSFSNTANVNLSTASGNTDVDINGAGTTSFTSSNAGAGALTVDRTGGNLNVTAASTTDGALTLRATNGNLIASGVVAGGTGRNLSLQTITAGSVCLAGAVSAACDTVTINSVDLVNGAGTVTGASVSLTGANGVGTLGPINTAAQSLTLGAATGGARVANSSAAAVSLAGATAGGTGLIDVTQSGGGALNVAGAVSTANGDVTLTANGANLTTSAGVTAGGAGRNALVRTVGSGNVTLNANLSAANDTTVQSAGSLEGTGALTAGNQLNLTGVQVGVAGPLHVSAPSVVVNDSGAGASTIQSCRATATTVSFTKSGAGDVVITQSGGGALDARGSTTDGAVAVTANGAALTIGNALTAGGAGRNVTLATVGSGDILLNAAVTAAGDTVSIDAAGAINGAGLVTGGSLDIDADTGIGNTTSLELAGCTITLDTLAGGVNADNALASAVTVSSLTSGGSGNVRFDQCGGGTVSFGTVSTASGDVTLTDTGAGLTVTGAVTAGGTANVTLQTIAAGNITLTGTTTAAGDQVTITSAGDIRGSGLVSASTVNLTGATGIGIAVGPVEIAATNVSANNPGGGGIDIHNTNAAATTVCSLTSAGAAPISFDQTGGGAVLFDIVNTGNGTIDLSNTGADLTVLTQVSAGGAGDVTLTTVTTGNVVLTGLTRAIGDSVTIVSAGSINGAGLITSLPLALTAVGGIGDLTPLSTKASTITGQAGAAIRINNCTTATTSVALQVVGTGDICFNQTGSAVLFSCLATTGNATLQATCADLVLGSLAIVGNVTARTLCSGRIDVAGVTNICGAATLQSAGCINGCGVLGANTLALTASTGIGNLSTLCTAAGSIVACTTTGGIALADSGATTVDLSAGGGTVVFDNFGGTLTVSAIDATGAGAVTLNSTNGNLQVTGAVTGSGSGTLTLRTLCTGDVVLVSSVTNTGAAVNVVSAGSVNGSGALQGSAVNVTAATGIGNTTALVLANAANVALTTASGNTDVDISGGGTTNLTSANVGTGSLTVDRSGGNLNVAAATTADGAVTLRATNGNLTASGVIAGGTGRNLSLQTLTAGSICLAGAVSAACDTVAINSVDLVNGGGTVTGASVSLTGANGVGTLGPINTAAQGLTLSAATGGARVANSSAAALSLAGATAGGTGLIDVAQTGGGALNVSGAVSTANGDVTLTANGGNLTTSAGVTAGGAGRNALVRTVGSGNVALNANLSGANDTTVQSAGSLEGTGTLTAGNQLNLTGVQVGVAGPLNVSAPTVIVNDSGAGASTLQSNRATATAFTVNKCGAGDVTVTQAGGGALALQGSTTNGSIAATNTGADLAVAGALTANGAGGNITLTTVTSGSIFQNLAVTAACDTVTLNSADAIQGSAAQITGATVALTAQDGIGTASPVITNANTVSATNTVGGCVVVQSAGAGNVTVSNLTTTPAGNVTFNHNRAGTVAFNTVTGNVVNLTSSGQDLSLCGTITAPAALQIAAGATGDVLVNTNQNIAGALTISGANLEGTGVLTLAVGRTACLTMAGAIGAVAPLQLSADAVNASAGTSLAIANARASAVTLSASAANGGLDFAQSGGGQLTIAGATGTNGALNLVNAGGNILVSGAIAGTGTGAALCLSTLTSGNIQLNAGVSATCGIAIGSAGFVEGAGVLTGPNVLVNAGTGIGASAALNFASACVQLSTAAGCVKGTTSLASPVTVAGSIAGLGGFCFQNTASALTAGCVTTTNGSINLVSAGALNICGTLTAGGGGNLSLTTGASLNTCQVLTGNLVGLTAQNGIGNLGALQVDATSVSFTNGTNGDVDIDFVNPCGTRLATVFAAGGGTVRLDNVTNSQLLVCGCFNAAGGSVILSSAGDLQGSGIITAASLDLSAASGIGSTTPLRLATGQLTANVSGAGDINVCVTTNAALSLAGASIAASGNITIAKLGLAGDLSIDGAVTSSCGVDLSSSGAIDHGGLITGGTVTLFGQLGIGTTATVRTATSSLTASAGGPIDIDNATACDSTVVLALSTPGNLNFDQTGGGQLTLASATVNNGNAAITNTGANLVISCAGANVGGAGRTLDLRTLGSGDVTVNGGTSAASVTLNSAGAIDGISTITAGTVSLTAVGGIGGACGQNLAASSISANNTGSGAIRIRNTSATASSVSVTAAGACSAFDFDQTGGGALSVSGVSAASGCITLKSSGDVDMVGSADAGTGRAVVCATGNLDGSGTIRGAQVALNAGGSIGAGTQVQTCSACVAIDAVSTASVRNIRSGNVDVDFSAGGGLFEHVGGGTLTILAASTPGGVLRMCNLGGDVSVSGLLSGGAGTIDVRGTGNVNVGGGIITSNLVKLQAGGAINGCGSITATTNLDLDAVTGIGNLGPLNVVAANTCALSTSGAIQLAINAPGAATLSSARTSNGQIDVVSLGSGGLTVTGRVDNAAGDINLTAVGSNLQVANTVAANNGNVNLTNTGGFDLGVSGTVQAFKGTASVVSGGDVRGPGLVGGCAVALQAGACIGCPGTPFTISGATVSATAGGSIHLTSAVCGPVAVTGLTSGASGAIDFENVSGDITFANVNPGAGGFCLATTAGNLTLLTQISNAAITSSALHTFEVGDISILGGINVPNAALQVSAASQLDAIGTLTANLVVLTAGADVGRAVQPIVTEANSLTAIAVGNVFVTQLGGVNVQTIAAGGNALFTVHCGDVALGTFQSRGDATINVVDGRMTDANGAGSNLESCGRINIFARGVVGTAADPLETNVAGRISVRTLASCGGVSGSFAGQVGNGGQILAIGGVPGTLLVNGANSTKRATSILTIAAIDPALAAELFGDAGRQAVLAIQTRDRVLARSLLRSQAAARFAGLSVSSALTPQEIADLNSLFGTPAPTPAPAPAPVTPPAPVIVVQATPAPAPTPAATTTFGGTAPVGGLASLGLLGGGLSGLGMLGGTGGLFVNVSALTGGGTAPVITAAAPAPSFSGTASPGASSFGGTPGFGGGTSLLGGTGSFGGLGGFGGFGLTSFGGLGGFGGFGLTSSGGLSSFGGFSNFSGLGGLGSLGGGFGGAGTGIVGGTATSSLTLDPALVGGTGVVLPPAPTLEGGTAATIGGLVVMPGAGSFVGGTR